MIFHASDKIFSFETRAMARRLPPLNAIRAFEAAARHLSFTKAAEELFVTQAAVSHQIKALEAALGLQLFRRFNRRLMLTDAGQAYLPPLRDALDQIAAATARLKSMEETGSLTVSVLPSFAAKWLLPRLSCFRERHPELDVLVSASHSLVDFGYDEVDLAIRYGLGRCGYRLCIAEVLGAGRFEVRVELVDSRHAGRNVEFRDVFVRDTLEHLHQGAQTVPMRCNEHVFPLPQRRNDSLLPAGLHAVEGDLQRLRRG